VAGIARQDYWLALRLPNKGLSYDNLHPSFDAAPGTSAIFTADYLLYGFNMRNLTALLVLDAVWQGAMYCLTSALLLSQAGEGEMQLGMDEINVRARRDGRGSIGRRQWFQLARWIAGKLPASELGAVNFRSRRISQGTAATGVLLDRKAMAAMIITPPLHRMERVS
jgi:hypothetical protein